MDPNEALAAIRTLVAVLRDDKVDADMLQAHAEAIADNFEALDEWLSHEGFLPAAWAIAGERG